MTWSSDILRWSEIYNLDPNLVATVMQIESCGHPSVLSSSGAIGLFQVMPFHFPHGEDPFDPETNAKRGLGYLARGLGLSGGRMDLALAGYNGGHGVISRDQSQWAPETQRYVSWGNGILNDIASGRTTSPSLQAWLQAGGERLCRSASIALNSLHLANSP
jgi:soluble lytic murein transglycosylase-like protein